MHEHKHLHDVAACILITLRFMYICCFIRFLLRFTISVIMCDDD